MENFQLSIVHSPLEKSGKFVCMLHPLLQMEKVEVKMGALIILRSISLNLYKNKPIAILGQSGSGKTVLARTLTGKHFFSGKITSRLSETSFSKDIVLVAQQHLFTDYTNTRTNLYYQQRFQSTEQETTRTVAEYLQEKHQDFNSDAYTDWIEWLSVTPLLSKKLIQLSNGENKRIQLFRAILSDPRILILDQPFIGLDVATREILSAALGKLAQKNITYILLSGTTQIPDSVETVYVLSNGTLSEGISRDTFMAAPEKFYQSESATVWHTELIPPPQPLTKDFENVVRLVNVNVHYNERYLLQDIHWTMKKGSAWCVYGHNGAGKSTLLSLITADHPQAYSNEVYLFDQRRGRGESIWDIKKNIGYISPELHLYFEPDATCFETVASGLFDTIGLFRKLRPDQVALTETWLKVLGLEALRDRLLKNCSAGQQRLLLLARACIKQPPLLVLDEPCQGLDDAQTAAFNRLIDHLYERQTISLIYVSHYQHQLPQCIEHYLQLEQGKATIIR